MMKKMKPMISGWAAICLRMLCKQGSRAAAGRQQGGSRGGIEASAGGQPSICACSAGSQQQHCGSRAGMEASAARAAAATAHAAGGLRHAGQQCLGGSAHLPHAALLLPAQPSAVELLRLGVGHSLGDNLQRKAAVGGIYKSAQVQAARGRVGPCNWVWACAEMLRAVVWCG